MKDNQATGQKQVAAVPDGLTAQDLDCLARSYITPELARASGIYRVDSEQGAQLVGRRPSAGTDYGGIVFPNYLPEAEHPREYRLRLDHPPLERKADGSLVEKGKYLSPPGRGNLAYFPPGTPLNHLTDPTVPIVIVEGEKKALALGRMFKEVSETVLVVGFPGVWGWRGRTGKTTYDGHTQEITKGPTRDFFSIKWSARQVIVWFDANAVTNPGVAWARDCLTREARAKGGCVAWAEVPLREQVNGVDDLLGKRGAEVVLDLYRQAQEAPDRQTRPAPSHIAAAFALSYRGELVWQVSAQRWMRYRAGVWREEPPDLVEQTFGADLDDLLPGGYGAGLLAGVTKLTQQRLAAREWQEPAGSIPFSNGTLDLETRTLRPHSPDDYFTWQLPYAYDPAARCEAIRTWLSGRVRGDRCTVETIRAYLRAILLGCAYLQRYLEAIGPGGAGKSTLIALARAMVGVENTASTELRHLEGGRFETYKLLDKRLIVLTDQERYGGGVATLKAITGNDPVRIERKYKDPHDAVIRAMVIIVANEPVQSSDYTSGLERRRLRVNFRDQIKAEDQRKVIEIDAQGRIAGELAASLPGLFNWVLDLPDDDMISLVKCTQDLNASQQEAWREALLQTNPLAEWMESSIVLDPAAKTYVGVAEQETIGSYKNTDRWLYANYCQRAKNTGLQLLSQRRFTPLFEDLCTAQLKLKDQVFRSRDNGGSFFKGLRLRQENEDDTYPTPITGSSTLPT
jgi:P4 family phage/plasmid primase-like protien